MDLAFASNSIIPSSSWLFHLTLNSDDICVELDITVPGTPHPDRPLSFNMREANWSIFTTSAKGNLREGSLDLLLDERAETITDGILQTAHLVILLTKPHSHRHRDA